MKNKLLLLIILLGELFTFSFWVPCAKVLDKFHFTTYDLQLRLIERIHYDQFVPLWETRVFHNKFAGALFDLIRSYVQFWDLGFLINTISLVGAVGVGVMFYHFCTQKKSRITGVLFTLVLLLPFVEIFNVSQIPPSIRVGIFILPLICWSLMGCWHLSKKKRGTWIIFVLMLVSVWYEVSIASAHLLCPRP